MPLRIAIIGSGPAGCALARLLQCNAAADTDAEEPPITVTIFEAEASIDFRSQGGTLDLHEKTGQAALKAAGLFEEFQKHARYDGEAMKLADKKLLCYVNMGGGTAGSSSGRPEIDRPVLREMLNNSLAPGTVRWNKKLMRVDADRTLHFADGSIETGFDLIVGADGAWSKVRRALTGELPHFSGIGGHSMSIPNAQKTESELYDLVNRGSLFSFSDGKALFAQYMGDGSLNVSTWSRHEPDWQKTCGYDVRDVEAVKAACRREYADWDPRLVALTQRVEDKIVPRDLFMLPVGHKWENVEGITCIGDAAHVMTPFAGEGVNLALEDALRLARAILSTLDSPSRMSPLTRGSTSAHPMSKSFAFASTFAAKEVLYQNVKKFEADMFCRATTTQQMTYDMMCAMYFVPGAPRNGIETYIVTALGGEMGWWMTKILTPAVYLWFWMFKLIW